MCDENKDDWDGDDWKNHLMPDGEINVEDRESYRNLDWDYKSREYKGSELWVCELCLTDFSKNKRFLHTHHLNGNNSDDKKENLISLCFACHAEMDGHSFMKRKPDYKEALELRKNLRRVKQKEVEYIKSIDRELFDSPNS